MTSKRTKAPDKKQTFQTSEDLDNGISSQISHLYELAGASDSIFGSPLGPVETAAGTRYLPHFVYFGPYSSLESLRLAVLTGFNSTELAASRALLALVHDLILQPDIGQGINVSFFPVVNVAGLLGGSGERDLLREHWGRSCQPEISLIRDYSKERSYQGFLRIGATSDKDASAVVRTILSTTAHPTNVELFSSSDFEPWQVSFETLPRATVPFGPLTFSGDPSRTPFEVELSLPIGWSQAQSDRALSRVLKRLIVGYRGFQAYGLHL